MTVRCGGGTSAPKPGFDQVVIGAGLITAGLGIIAPWLLSVGVLIDAFVYDVAAECPSDPPAMPSSADLAITNVIPGGILNPGFETWKTAVQNLLLNWAWNQYCQCTSGALVPPVYPPAPTQKIPSTTGVASCLSGHWSGMVTRKNTPGTQLGDFTSLMSMFPAGTGITVTVDGPAFVCLPVPAGAVSISWQGVGTSGLGGISIAGLNSSVEFDGFSSPTVGTDSFDLVLNSTVTGLSFSGTKAISPSTKFFYLSAITSNNAGNPNPSALDIEVSFNCSLAVGTSEPCCPPDPGLLTAIQQLYQLVQSIYLGLPHQLNSYADGITHAGLSGNGTITLAASVLGIRVNITTDPASLGVDIGDPNYLFDRGFIVPVVNSAPIRADSRLVYNPQTFLVPLLTEQIGYSLHPGVIVSITELVRGP